ncbi:MAG TPA: hypothetical protein VFT53_00210 [Candidatus Saccharimonadales bacterium]|nr:hypothetical protein [Candidatus Saccharimonadales bacterium]
MSETINLAGSDAEWAWRQEEQEQLNQTPEGLYPDDGGVYLSPIEEQSADAVAKLNS